MNWRVQEICEFSEKRMERKHTFKKLANGTSLVIQWLRLCALSAGGPGFDLWSGNLRSRMPIGPVKKKKKNWLISVRQTTFIILLIPQRHSKLWVSLAPFHKWGDKDLSCYTACQRTGKCQQIQDSNPVWLVAKAGHWGKVTDCCPRVPLHTCTYVWDFPHSSTMGGGARQGGSGARWSLALIIVLLKAFWRILEIKRNVNLNNTKREPVVCSHSPISAGAPINTCLGKKKTNTKRDFPGGPVVKNPPSNAGDVGSIPGRGTKIPHTTGQLSLRAATTELASLNERARVPQTTEPMYPGAHVPQLERENLHATAREKPMRHKERSHMPQRRSCVPQLRPDAAKNINK